jgi:hypothetical protein
MLGKTLKGRTMRSLFALVLWLLASGQALAMQPRTEHTYQLSAGEPAPTAGIEAAAWMAGSWRGSAFGSTFEEVWNPPSAGTMVGLFKLMDNDQVSFYEIMLLVVVDGRLSLRVKHFSADFVAWEAQEDFVDFKLVGVEPDALHFSGISFYRLGPNEIEAYIVMKSEDTIREEKLTYRRVGADS